MHEVLVNRLGGLSLPRKSVVRLTDRPDMTLDVYRGRKTTIQYNTKINLNRICSLEKPIPSLKSRRSCHSVMQTVNRAEKRGNDFAVVILDRFRDSKRFRNSLAYQIIIVSLEHLSLLIPYSLYFR